MIYYATTSAIIDLFVQYATKVKYRTDSVVLEDTLCIVYFFVLNKMIFPFIIKD